MSGARTERAARLSATAADNPGSGVLRLTGHVLGAAILGLVFLILMAAGCSRVKTVSTDIFADDTLQVRLLEETDKSGEPIPKGYSHPWNVDAGALDALLQSIQYQQNIIFFHQKPKKAFPAPDRERMLKPFLEAFGRATPNQAIDFAFVFKKRWLVFQRQYDTDGIMFVKDGRLNVAFRNLAFEQVADPEGTAVAFNGDPTRTPVRSDWALVPGPGQTLVEAESRQLLGPKTFSNWIRLDLSRDWVAQQKQEEAAAAAAAAGSGAVATPAVAAPAVAAPGAASPEVAAPGVGAPGVASPGVAPPGVAPPVVAAPPPPLSTEALPTTRDEVDRQLEFLEQLHSEGAVTDAYYQHKKHQLLERYHSLPGEPRPKMDR